MNGKVVKVGASLAKLRDGIKTVSSAPIPYGPPGPQSSFNRDGEDMMILREGILTMRRLTYHDGQLGQFDRVRHMSTDTANRAIDASTREAIEGATAGGRAAIEQRLAALQQEWDIDRVLMVNFAALVFAQLVAATRDRRWLWGPLVQTPFLMMHATLGWCPPSLWFRPMGFRTRFEIQSEREELLRRLGELPA